MLVLLGLAAPTSARAEPSDRTLFYTGLAMAPPTYVIGVTLHEGSHALAAKLVGAEVVELHLFPPGIDPKVHAFRFGWTYVHGLRTDRDKIFFYIAPKITDSVLLGGFAALVFTGAWPHNRYGQLALTVVATGLWVDFSKDVVRFAARTTSSRCSTCGASTAGARSRRGSSTPRRSWGSGSSWRAATSARSMIQILR